VATVHGALDALVSNFLKHPRALFASPTKLSLGYVCCIYKGSLDDNGCNDLIVRMYCD